MSRSPNPLEGSAEPHNGDAGSARAHSTRVDSAETDSTRAGSTDATLPNRTEPKPTEAGRLARSRQIFQQFLRFGIVGFSGFFVNQVVFILSKKLGGHWSIDDLDVMFNLFGTQWNVRWYHLFSVIAFLVANVWNFFLNRQWTFRGHTKQAWWIQLPRFMAVGIFGLLITLVVSTLVVHHGSPLALPEDVFDNSTGLRTRSYWGNFLGVVFSMPANFLFNKLWTFSTKKGKAK